MTTQPNLEQAARECAEKCVEMTKGYFRSDQRAQSLAATLTPLILEAMRGVVTEAVVKNIATSETYKMRESYRNEWQRDTTMPVQQERKLPTVEELQAILDDPTPRKIVVQPDGSIRAEPAEPAQTETAALREQLEAVTKERDEARCTLLGEIVAALKGPNVGLRANEIVPAINALTTTNARMREALEPFARSFDEELKDGCLLQVFGVEDTLWSTAISIGHCRAAKSALADSGPDPVAELRSPVEKHAWPNCHEVQCEQAHEILRCVMQLLGIECDDNIYVIGKTIRVHQQIDELKADAEIGQKWRKDSSLQTWFPFTAEEMVNLRAENERLRTALASKGGGGGIVSKYIERQTKACAEWFKDHAIESRRLLVEAGTTSPRIELLRWRRPASWNFAVDYLIYGNTLFVSGDIGKAAYQWGQQVTFEWLAGCDLGYFAEKCEASESGKDFEYWDHETAELRIREWAKETRQTKLTVNELCGNAQTKNDFHDSLRDAKDFDICEALWDCGLVVHPRCIGHWLGIKLAVTTTGKGAGV